MKKILIGFFMAMFMMGIVYAGAIALTKTSV